MKFFKNSILFLLLITGAGLTACTPPGSGGEPIRRTQFIMGTLVEITISGADPQVAQMASSQAFDEFSRIEKLMSTYIAESEISKFNLAAGGDPQSLSRETMTVLKEGLHWSKLSSGAFDITIEPLTRLWDFDGKVPSVPSPEALKRAINLVGHNDLQLDEKGARLKRPGMAINLGSIAKGYAVDRAYEILKGLVPAGIINAGGDLMAFGQRGPDQPWIIGLQHPRKPQDLLASFGVEGWAVATSGDYQRYFEQDGVRYHHLLDPKTGMPARGLTSVTIKASNVMQADALATAVFVLGPDRGFTWVDAMEDVEAMLILPDGSQKFTDRFREQPQFTLR